MNTFVIIFVVILFLIITSVHIIRNRKKVVVEDVQNVVVSTKLTSEPPIRGIYPVASRSSYASSIVSNSNHICNLALSRKIYANKADTMPNGGVQLFNEPELITPLRGGGWLCIMWNQKVKMYGYVNVDGKVSNKYPFKNC